MGVYRPHFSRTCVPASVALLGTVNRNTLSYIALLRSIYTPLQAFTCSTQFGGLKRRPTNPTKILAALARSLCVRCALVDRKGHRLDRISLISIMSALSYDVIIQSEIVYRATFERKLAGLIMVILGRLCIMVLGATSVFRIPEMYAEEEFPYLMKFLELKSTNLGRRNKFV